MCFTVKKFKTFNRAAIILLAFVMSTLLFAGCGNRNTSSSKNSTQNLVEKQPNKDEIKKNYETGLQTLVNDATITKDQSSKILDALIANIDNISEESGEKQKDTLNKLVSDKVITQEQADKVINALTKNR
jgi:polyhydroxyalkanoate synthesis regulator phasin